MKITVEVDDTVDEVEDCNILIQALQQIRARYQDPPKESILEEKFPFALKPRGRPKKDVTL